MHKKTTKLHLMRVIAHIGPITKCSEHGIYDSALPESFTGKISRLGWLWSRRSPGKVHCAYSSSRVSASPLGRRGGERENKHYYILFSWWNRNPHCSTSWRKYVFCGSQTQVWCVIITKNHGWFSGDSLLAILIHIWAGLEKYGIIFDFSENNKTAPLSLICSLGQYIPFCFLFIASYSERTGQ